MTFDADHAVAGLIVDVFVTRDGALASNLGTYLRNASPKSASVVTKPAQLRKSLK
ncbi:MAG: hypothetical protein V3V08_04710 [Nannocystaceae bacterium]